MNFLKKIANFFGFGSESTISKTSLLKEVEIVNEPTSNDVPKKKKPRNKKPKTPKTVETVETPQPKNEDTPKKKKPYRRRPKPKKKVDE